MSRNRLTSGMLICLYIIAVTACRSMDRRPASLPSGTYISELRGQPYILVLDTIKMTYVQACNIDDSTRLHNKGTWELKKGKICFEHWKDFDNLDGRGYNYCEDCCASFSNERISFFSDPDEDAYRGFNRLN